MNQFFIPAISFGFTRKAMIAMVVMLSYAHIVKGEQLLLTVTIDSETMDKLLIREVRATLSTDEDVQSLVLQVKGTEIEGEFNNVSPGYGKLDIELLAGSNTFSSGSATGIIAPGSVVRAGAQTLFAGNKAKVIVDWDTTTTFSTDDLLNYTISNDNTQIKVYDLKNIEEKAAAYRAEGMLYFSGVGVVWNWLDEDMTPWYTHPSGGLYRVSVSVCHTAFGFHKYYRQTNREDYRQYFLNNVDWLVENHDENFYLLYWYEKKHAAQQLDVPWVSAMAQGEALAATSMAYDLTGEQKYLDAAEGFFNTLTSNTGKYWSIGLDGADYYWLEEYPNQSFCHVFNGFMFGLWGLWDYYVVTGNEFALKLFSAGIRSVADNYPRWNVKDEDGTAYCWHFDWTQSTYHPIHIFQLEKYDEYFDIPEFRDAIEFFTNSYPASTGKSLPENYRLKQNHPNPFNSTTSINFTTTSYENVNLIIYNALGQKVRHLVKSHIVPGNHTAVWNGTDDYGSNVSSGLYFYRLQASDTVLTRKLILMK